MLSYSNMLSALRLIGTRFEVSLKSARERTPFSRSKSWRISSPDPDLAVEHLELDGCQSIANARSHFADAVLEPEQSTMSCTHDPRAIPIHEFIFLPSHPGVVVVRTSVPIAEYLTSAPDDEHRVSTFAEWIKPSRVAILNVL